MNKQSRDVMADCSKLNDPVGHIGVVVISAQIHQMPTTESFSMERQSCLMVRNKNI